jgi:uncharacterized protein (DUF983 family)
MWLLLVGGRRKRVKIVQVICVIFGIIAVAFFFYMEMKINILFWKKFWIPLCVLIGIGIIASIIKGKEK